MHYLKFQTSCVSVRYFLYRNYIFCVVMLDSKASTSFRGSLTNPSFLIGILRSQLKENMLLCNRVHEFHLVEMLQLEQYYLFVSSTGPSNKSNFAIHRPSRIIFNPQICLYSRIFFTSSRCAIAYP